jgi:hypothetical protein
MFPGFKKIIREAVDLVDSVPGYSTIAGRLRRLRIDYLPSLPDRAHTTMLSQIIVGPKALLNLDKTAFSLAATLVHEEFHTRQNPLLKTVSFWTGVLTRTPTMARYEWPAYRAQTAFLRALAGQRPDLREAIDHELNAIVESVHRYYGRPPEEL